MSHRPSNASTDTFIVLIRPRKAFADEIKNALLIKIRKQLLKEYQLVPYDIQFVTFALPKTTSGKLQRHECHDNYVEHFTREKGVLYVQ